MFIFVWFVDLVHVALFAGSRLDSQSNVLHVQFLSTIQCFSM